MIEQTGEVIGVEGEYAWVATEADPGCGSCAVSKGCGTSVLASLFGRRTASLRVLNRACAMPGDRVVIGLSETGLVRGSLAVYMVPLGGLFAGAVTGSQLGGYFGAMQAELVSILGGLAGLAAGLVWLRYFTRSIDNDGRYQPVVLRHELVSGSAKRKTVT